MTESNLSSTVYLVTEHTDRGVTDIIGIFSNKLDALAEAHSTANNKQARMYPGSELDQRSGHGDTDYVELGTIHWTIAPQEVQ